MTNTKTFTENDVRLVAEAIKEIIDYSNSFGEEAAIAFHARLTRYFKNKVNRGASYELLSQAVNQAMVLDHYLTAEEIKAYIEYQEDVQGLES